MAEANAKCNLIINYLPQNMSDQEFFDLFSSVGKTSSTRIIRDKNTNYSFGYGFVNYENPEDAAKAIEQLNGQAIQHKTIKVAYSQPSGGQTKNINLHVSGLPIDATDEQIQAIFAPFGNIVQCRVIKDKSSGQGQGFGFVLFSSRDEALVAIKNLNGSLYPNSNDNVLVVKFAKTEQKGPPPSFMKRTNYSYNNALLGNQGRGGGPMRGHSFLGRYSPMTSRGPYSTAYPTITAAGDAKYFPPAKETIVFVYGIGPEMDENQLWQLFSPYGTIVKVNVIWDHVKGSGKGYGFVTFRSHSEAIYAIQSLNGMTHDSRTLQVSLKS